MNSKAKIFPGLNEFDAHPFSDFVKAVSFKKAVAGKAFNLLKKSGAIPVNQVVLEVSWPGERVETRRPRKPVNYCLNCRLMVVIALQLRMR